MKDEKPLTPDDIELVPGAWDRFKRAVPIIARHKPVDKKPEPPKRPRRRSIQKRQA
jgi:hypothetical protein